MFVSLFNKVYTIYYLLVTTQYSLSVKCQCQTPVPQVPRARPRCPGEGDD